MKKPFVLCLIGMSGSGKTTLAKEISNKLLGKDMPVQIIDGDILRAQLGNLFGYTRNERIRQSQVVRVLAKYLVDNGINVIIAIVAPYEEIRAGLRDYLGDSYLEVYVSCSYGVRAKRDTKGYYKLCEQQKMDNLNGTNDIYEPPEHADLTVKTDETSKPQCVEQIIALLKEHGYEV